MFGSLRLNSLRILALNTLTNLAKMPSFADPDTTSV